MAKNDAYLIANPTPAAIEVGGVKVEPGHVISTTIDEEAHPAYLSEFVSKGCTVAPGSKANAIATVTDVLDNETQLVEKGARLLGSMARAVISAGGDEFAKKGL